MALKFYMTPGSCSTGIHILLETLELPFEVWVVNIPAGDHLRPDYLKINPRGTIPTLVLNDGTALTDFKSIALWLAQTYPRAKLLPEDPALAAQAVDLLEFALIQLHGEGFTRIFTSERYISSGGTKPGQQLKDDVTSHGREIVEQAFAVLEKRLPAEGYAVGPTFSIADAALFYNEFWAEKTGIPMPPRVLAHYQRVRARPVVRQVLAEEGYRT
ncbi:glutathione S-transferase family protein [Xanthobacter autotrophicus]|uniref:Glutathione S-transferase family protein n=1 Tax=Xanthobacter autotrophicus TaxID=280 RepID=A0A6C1KEU2_XANAU|nr:glutathione S-transferase family protein [Xanthobacter autotrophicus]TLX42755.1 glutathione S-transferase family protein [Xanthobacter autotrophicus]